MNHYNDNIDYHEYENHDHEEISDNSSMINNDLFSYICLLLIFLYFSSFFYKICECRHQRTNNNTGNTQVLLDPNRIEKKEIIFMKNSSDINNPLYDNTCSICLEPYINNDKLYQLTCNHYYHQICINHWLQKKTSCPLCRINLV